MDRIISLNDIVQHEVEDYAGPLYKGRMFAVSDTERQLFTVVTLPDADAPAAMRANIVVLAQVVGDKVIIERDITDRPLAEQLQQAGIACEQIVLAYAGEAHSN
jgi:hypothetical protein